MRQKDLSRAISKLIEVGFTEYQAKAYAGLLTVSSAKATDLSKIISVPKAKIYQILGELLEMGAIRKKQTKPVAYSALPPEKALSNMLAWRGQKNQRELELMQELGAETLPALEKVSQEPRPLSKTQFLEIIPVGDISEVETKNLINSAKRELRIMTGTFEYLPQIEDDLKSAKNRGVSIKVLLKKPGNPHAKKVQEEVTKILKYLKIDYKHIQEMPLRGTITDSSQVIFGVDESRVLPVLKEIAISRNRNMAKALNTYFDFMWKSN
jgi:sugar-specific transcriptional regulator TrmB